MNEGGGGGRARKEGREGVRERELLLVIIIRRDSFSELFI